MTKNKKHTKSKKSALNKSLNFTPADLQANQQGFLSFEQKRRLRRLRLLGGTMWISGIWLLINLANLLLMGLILVAGLMGELDESMILTFVVLGLILIPFSGAMVYMTAKIIYEYWQEMSADIVRGDVAKVEGILRHKTVPSGKVSNFYIVINDEKFPVWESVQEQFADNTPYQIFYTPESRFLLSATQITPEELANE